MKLLFFGCSEYVPYLLYRIYYGCGAKDPLPSGKKRAAFREIIPFVAKIRPDLYFRCRPVFLGAGKLYEGEIVS